MQPDVFIFNDGMSPKSLESFLDASSTIKWFHREKTRITWFDTFESALLRKSCFLHLQKGMLTLEHTQNSEMVYSQGWKSKKNPQKLNDFPEGGLKNQLLPMLSGRALMPVLSTGITISPFNFIDEDGKILAQGRLMGLENEASLLVLRTIRGYGAEVGMLINCFPGHQKARNIHEALFSAYHIRPNIYSSKPELRLNTFSGTAAALYEIFNANYKIMRQNETGVIQDIDIEFLHDFRVAGRRMRSALSLIKGVLQRDKTKALKDSLKTIGMYSGPLRDLDVYLLKQNEYASLLPTGWESKELAKFFHGIKSARGRALTRLRLFLGSTQYKDILALWDDFFSSYSTFIKTDLPLQRNASRLIRKQFTRLVSDGAQLNSDSPDEAFHILRIDAKKLRYLLEFFQSLSGESHSVAAIKQLKALQDNLGAFNDLSVQIEFLEKHLDGRSKGNSGSKVRTIAAIIGALHYEKGLLRAAFGQLYISFSSDKNQQIFEQLIKENPA